MVKTINNFTIGCDYMVSCIPSTATFFPAKLSLVPIRAFLRSVQYENLELSYCLKYYVFYELYFVKKQVHVDIKLNSRKVSLGLSLCKLRFWSCMFSRA